MRYYRSLSVVGMLMLWSLMVGCGSVRWEQGRPRIYDIPEIKRVAVLSFGNPEFTDTVTEILVHNSRWNVMDRATLDRILKEQDLQQSSRFDKETAVRIGKLAGVDLVIFGDYRGSRAVMKAVFVQTGEYLVYKNVALNTQDKIRFKAVYSCQYLVPYAIGRQGGNPVQIIVGPGADQGDPEQSKLE